MTNLTISTLEATDPAIEVVERKGLGHPDTICDALAETLSRNLCREYLQRFGRILHHNVDKALLCAGRAAPAFSAGEVLAPINIYLAGRAVLGLGNDSVPIDELAIEGSRAWIRANMHGLDAEQHVIIHQLVQPGSQDLQQLFSRHPAGDVILANDTSIGIGYAPLSQLEWLVLEAEQTIIRDSRKGEHLSWGEDIKVMGIRQGRRVRLTVACAMIGRYLAHIDDYLAEKLAIQRAVLELASKHGFSDCVVDVNMADDPASGGIYLTVTGTSAEAGDDGQVGRGNRINGLITPCRPMSLEAAAGKNPRSHVGKTYNIVARRICEALVATLPEILAAQCLLVSQIGAPITSPALLHVKIAPREGFPASRLSAHVREIATHQLTELSQLMHALLEGTIGLF
jgi:S-adenosylmethionine synthetase